MKVEAIFTNNLATEREARGLGTAGELARQAEIEPALYARTEAGEILPSMAELKRLTEALGVERSQLFCNRYEDLELREYPGTPGQMQQMRHELAAIAR